MYSFPRFQGTCQQSSVGFFRAFPAGGHALRGGRAGAGAARRRQDSTSPWSQLAGDGIRGTPPPRVDETGPGILESTAAKTPKGETRLGLLRTEQSYRSRAINQYFVHTPWASASYKVRTPTHGSRSPSFSSSFSTPPVVDTPPSPALLCPT